MSKIRGNPPLSCMLSIGKKFNKLILVICRWIDETNEIRFEIGNK